MNYLFFLVIIPAILSLMIYLLLELMSNNKPSAAAAVPLPAGNAPPLSPLFETEAALPPTEYEPIGLSRLSIVDPLILSEDRTEDTAPHSLGPETNEDRPFAEG